MRQHRHVAPGHDRPDLAADRPQQDFAGEPRRLVSVDMRIGAVAGNHRRVGDDLVIKIGVHVERDRDRGHRVDRAQPLQELSLAILQALRDHGAVQVEHDAVEPALCRRGADPLGDLGIGGVLDRAARRRSGGDRQYDLGPFARGQIEIGAEPGAGPAIGADRRLAVKRPRPVAEPRERRRHRRKGVGLVLHHRDQQAHALSSQPSRPHNSGEPAGRVGGSKWPATRSKTITRAAISAR